MDDTLFDHTGTCRRALRWLAGRTPALQGRPFAEVARRYGELLEEIQPDIFAGRIDHDAARDLRFQELLTYCGAAPSREEAHRLSTRYRARYQAVRRAVPGARNLLRALHPRAFIGIISNNHA